VPPSTTVSSYLEQSLIDAGQDLCTPPAALTSATGSESHRKCFKVTRLLDILGVASGSLIIYIPQIVSMEYILEVSIGANLHDNPRYTILNCCCVHKAYLGSSPKHAVVVFSHIQVSPSMRRSLGEGRSHPGQH